MIRIPGRIPISIYPAFWIIAALIGYINSFSFAGTIIWMLIIFISVLVHEFGHALTSLFFGKNPRIELVAFGGLTHHEGENLSYWKQFLIVLNGPVFGFLLFLGATALLKFTHVTHPGIEMALRVTQWINLVWTLLNLVPIMPLDGGQLLRITCEGFWGVRGYKYALIISAVIAALVSLGFFLYHLFLAGALFFLFAFQSFDSWKKSKLLSSQDRNEKLKKQLEAAEHALHEGRLEEARTQLHDVRTHAKEGILFLLATQYLAYIAYEEGDSKQTYDLLFPHQDSLSPDALSLLHKAAFDQKNYPLVITLAGPCYQAWPSIECALRNAFASAALSQAESAVGWLQTAEKEGLENLSEILKDPLFDGIRKDPTFQEFSN